MTPDGSELEAPIVQAPSDLGICSLEHPGNSISAQLEWASVPGATSYQVQTSESDFTVTDMQATVTWTCRWCCPVYWYDYCGCSETWRVRALRNGETGPWTEGTVGWAVHLPPPTPSPTQAPELTWTITPTPAQSETPPAPTAIASPTLTPTITESPAPTPTPWPVDTDRDGLSDPDEAIHGTIPNDKDSDDDGIEDGVEIIKGTDPLDPDDPPAAQKLDSDHDGLPDFLDPFPENADGDGDGYKDSYEIVMNTDPANPNSFPSLGDVDYNGFLNNADAIIVFNIFLNNTEMNQFGASPEGLDVNRSGGVDNVDAVILYFRSLGYSTLLPFN